MYAMRPLISVRSGLLLLSHVHRIPTPITRHLQSMLHFFACECMPSVHDTQCLKLNEKPRHRRRRVPLDLQRRVPRWSNNPGPNVHTIRVLPKSEGDF